MLLIIIKMFNSMIIIFCRRDHGDNFPFDGKGVILAHAFFPTGTRSTVQVHFDADEVWTTSGDTEQGNITHLLK